MLTKAELLTDMLKFLGKYKWWSYRRQEYIRKTTLLVHIFKLCELFVENWLEKMKA